MLVKNLLFQWYAPSLFAHHLFISTELDIFATLLDSIYHQQRRLVDIKPELRSSIGMQLMHLHALLGLVLSAAEGILSELLEAHRTVSISCLDNFVLISFSLFWENSFRKIPNPVF